MQEQTRNTGRIFSEDVKHELFLKLIAYAGAQIERKALLYAMVTVVMLMFGFAGVRG